MKICNHQVGGSSPFTGSNFYRALADFQKVDAVKSVADGRALSFLRVSAAFFAASGLNVAWELDANSIANQETMNCLLLALFRARGKQFPNLPK